MRGDQRPSARPRCDRTDLEAEPATYRCTDKWGSGSMDNRESVAGRLQGHTGETGQETCRGAEDELSEQRVPPEAHYVH